MFREDVHVSDMREIIDKTLANPPDPLSMQNNSGENYYNNRIDWGKETQRFSRDWINYGKGRISLDDETSSLEFALDVDGQLIVQGMMAGKGHIDLAFGNNCLCAGTLEFNEKGFLTGIHLDSGHYCPEVEHGKYFIAILLKYYNDLNTLRGQRNLEHFLDNVKVHIYNNKTKSFDVCTAVDIMTGRYLENLKQQEILEQQRLERQMHEQRMREKGVRIHSLGTFIGELLKFNSTELSRLNGQKPVTGKKDHAAKKAAFQKNVTNLTALYAFVKAPANSANLDEDILKTRINQYLIDTKNTCDMRSHENIDQVVKFFTRKDAKIDTQKNYDTFVKENKLHIDNLNKASEAKIPESYLEFK